MLTDFNAIMLMLLGVFLVVRFVNSFEGKGGKSYSARKLVLNFIMLVIYILSIPQTWR